MPTPLTDPQTIFPLHLCLTRQRRLTAEAVGGIHQWLEKEKGTGDESPLQATTVGERMPRSKHHTGGGRRSSEIRAGSLITERSVCGGQRPRSRSLLEPWQSWNIALFIQERVSLHANAQKCDGEGSVLHRSTRAARRETSTSYFLRRGDRKT